MDKIDGDLDGFARSHQHDVIPAEVAHRAAAWACSASSSVASLKALANHCHKTNPRIASAEEYRDMLAASL